MSSVYRRDLLVQLFFFFFVTHFFTSSSVGVISSKNFRLLQLSVPHHPVIYKHQGHVKLLSAVVNRCMLNALQLCTDLFVNKFCKQVYFLRKRLFLFLSLICMLFMLEVIRSIQNKYIIYCVTRILECHAHL